MILPLQFRIQQVFVAVDLDAQLVAELGVDNEAHQLHIVEGVIASRIMIELLGVTSSGIRLQNVVIGIAVRREHAADDNVSVASLVAADTGSQSADGVGLEPSLQSG